MNANTQELVLKELEGFPEAGVWEVLDFIRFLKLQFSRMTPEERFDRLWMTARRTAAERGITDEDIGTEIAAVRQGG